MKAQDITNTLKLADEIRNFNDCYTDANLIGSCEGMVTPENLLAFLIENPHMQEIANKIHRLSAL